MRICLYTETALPKVGGQEMVVDALARQFKAQGHKVIVLAPHPRRPLRARDETLPYPVIRHPPFFSTRYFVSWYRGYLERALRDHEIDIVHCHGLYPPGYIASLSRARIPTVITSHGGDVHSGNVRLAKPLVKRRIQSGLAGADALIAISRFTDDGFRALGSTAPMYCIPNGVDLSPFATFVSRPAGLPDALSVRNYFLFLGRLKSRKGADVLLRAYAQSSSRLPLVIAGEGEERSALEVLSARLGIRERTWFVGAVQHPTKTYLLQNALAVAVPSRVWEAFGLVVLEGFAAGTPVIATRLPGLEDLVSPGNTGWLVEPDNPDQLADALDDACTRREDTARMGQEASRQAQAFSWTEIARRHIALYQKLVSRQKLAA